MKNIIKISLSLVFMLLVIGTVYAFDIDSLTPIGDYNDFQDGCSTYRTNNERYFLVNKIFSAQEEFFENMSGYTVTHVGDNIYFFEDEDFEYYGYQELVTIDDENYLVTINQESKLSPSEQTEFLNDLKDFNKKNNLEPIAV